MPFDGHIVSRKSINNARRALAAHAAFAPRKEAATWKQCRFLGRLLATAGMPLTAIGLDKVNAPLTERAAKAAIDELRQAAPRQDGRTAAKAAPAKIAPAPVPADLPAPAPVKPAPAPVAPVTVETVETGEGPALPAHFMEWLAADIWQAERARGNRAVSKFETWHFETAKRAIGAYIESHQRYGGAWTDDADLDAIEAVRAWLRARIARDSVAGKWLTKHDSGAFKSGNRRVNIAEQHRGSYPVMVETDGKPARLLDAASRSWLKDLGAALA